MKLENGACVLIILHSPREKIVGIVHDISPAGIQIRGIDRDYFDDWSRAIAAGDDYLPMSDYFFPMWRVERMTRDESISGMPSMAEQFTERTNLRLEDL